MLRLLMLLISTLITNISLSQNIGWAEQDLQYIHTTIIENHPGMHNTDDPNFSSNLNLFFQDALNQLTSATTDNDKKAILHTFGKRFNDSHLGIGFPTKNVIAEPDEPFSCIKITSDVLWTRIPFFMLREKDKPIMESIITAMPTHRTFPYIVFDLRGNRGGSSIWGERIANALFDEAFAHKKRAQAQAMQYVEWRASADNIHYWHSLIPYITNAFGPESDACLRALAIEKGMSQAYDAGKIYYRENSKYQNSSNCATKSLYTNTIIAVIDKYCASACLDFIDELKLLSTHIILVGQQTGADSLYMDVRNIPLPSGKGFLRLPIKVYRNRPRGHNVPYVPDILYTGDMKDTKTIQEWVLQIK